MNLVRLDHLVQRRFDAAMGRLSMHDIHAPAVLRELSAGLIVTTIMVAVSLMGIVDWFTMSCILFFLGFSGAVNLRGWKRFDSDAKLDWTPALAKKYVDRALRMRIRMMFYRWFNLMMLPAMGIMLAVGMLLNRIEVGTVPALVAVSLRLLVSFVEGHVEASVPLPPPPPRALAVPT